MRYVDRDYDNVAIRLSINAVQAAPVEHRNAGRQMGGKKMLGGRNIPNTILLQGAPVLAACAMAASGQAWAQEGPQNTPSSVVEDVVVTARRADESIQHKKHTDVIVDWIVVDSAGKALGNSITEVPQRASGVAIVRFSALGDPDGSSAEGGGGFE